MQYNEPEFVKKLAHLKEFIQILYDEAEIEKQDDYQKKKMILEKISSLENYISTDMESSLPWVSVEDEHATPSGDAEQIQANDNWKYILQNYEECKQINKYMVHLYIQGRGCIFKRSRGFVLHLFEELKKCPIGPKYNYIVENLKRMIDKDHFDQFELVKNILTFINKVEMENKFSKVYKQPSRMPYIGYALFELPFVNMLSMINPIEKLNHVVHESDDKYQQRFLIHKLFAEHRKHEEKYDPTKLGDERYKRLQSVLKKVIDKATVGDHSTPESDDSDVEVQDNVWCKPPPPPGAPPGPPPRSNSTRYYEARDHQPRPHVDPHAFKYSTHFRDSDIKDFTGPRPNASTHPNNHDSNASTHPNNHDSNPSSDRYVDASGYGWPDSGGEFLKSDSLFRYINDNNLSPKLSDTDDDASEKSFYRRHYKQRAISDTDDDSSEKRSDTDDDSSEKSHDPEDDSSVKSHDPDNDLTEKSWFDSENDENRVGSRGSLNSTIDGEEYVNDERSLIPYQEHPGFVNEQGSLDSRIDGEEYVNDERKLIPYQEHPGADRGDEYNAGRPLWGQDYGQFDERENRRAFEEERSSPSNFTNAASGNAASGNAALSDAAFLEMLHLENPGSSGGSHDHDAYKQDNSDDDELGSDYIKGGGGSSEGSSEESGEASDEASDEASGSERDIYPPEPQNHQGSLTGPKDGLQFVNDVRADRRANSSALDGHGLHLNDVRADRRANSSALDGHGLHLYGRGRGRGRWSFSGLSKKIRSFVRPKKDESVGTGSNGEDNEAGAAELTNHTGYSSTMPNGENHESVGMGSGEEHDNETYEAGSGEEHDNETYEAGSGEEHDNETYETESGEEHDNEDDDT